MPTLTTPVRPKTKLSVNLSDDAAQVVRELAEARGSNSSDIIREAIALYRFMVTELRSGAHVELVRDESGLRERVHFVFAP